MHTIEVNYWNSCNPTIRSNSIVDSEFKEYQVASIMPTKVLEFLEDQGLFIFGDYYPSWDDIAIKESDNGFYFHSMPSSPVQFLVDVEVIN